MFGKRNEKSYLEGELNATKACGKALAEAGPNIQKHFTDKEMVIILEEYLEIMKRASQYIWAKNKELGINIEGTVSEHKNSI